MDDIFDVVEQEEYVLFHKSKINKLIESLEKLTNKKVKLVK